MPVTFDNELKAPPTECVTRELVPWAIPKPNYAGPFTKPYAGFWVKSLKPVDMFLKRLNGFPIILRLPNIL